MNQFDNHFFVSDQSYAFAYLHFTITVKGKKGEKG